MGEIPGSSEAARRFGGAASVDEITFPAKGFAGLTLRLYHPAARQWPLYWLTDLTRRT